MAHWRDAYRAKLSDAAAAAARVHSGDTIAIPSCGAGPWRILEALAKRPDVRGVRICHATLWGPMYHLKPENAEKMRTLALFLTANARKAMLDGRVDFVPVNLGHVAHLFHSGALPVDVAVLHLSPPDDEGYCTFGVYVAYMRAAAEAAKVVVAEVNDQMPRTYGDTRIHVSQLDAIVEVSARLPEIPPGESTDIERRIGEHVAALVEDGATLQLGRGGMPDAVLAFLGDKRDLGIHTELYSDTVVEMVKRGVITGARKTLHPGKLIAGFLDGSRKLYDFVHNNPMVEMHRSEYVNDPAVIGQNDNLVAINSAVEVDLTGQINAESVGTRLLSGAGGQLDFALGAWRSNNGKFIIAMPSTASQHSRIVARLGDGAAVTVPRTLAQFVVTEYGLADLRGASLNQRAKALIAIAHPDHREALERAARERSDLHI